MHKKLTWNAVGLYQKVELLLEKIKINQGELPKENLTDFRKHQRFVDKLPCFANYILHSPYTPKFI